MDPAGAMPRDQLAAVAKAQLEAAVGQPADSLVCDGDLRAELGATQRCVLTAGDIRLGVTATVVGVDGDTVQIDVQVDNRPME